MVVGFVGGRMDEESPDDRDLAERVAALEEAIEELRRELRVDQGVRGARGPEHRDRDRARRRGPGPRDVLRATDRYLIPSVIVVLEANIKALEVLQKAIRVTDRERYDPEGGWSREALERVDETLHHLQEQFEGGSLPQQPVAREVLERARELRDEVRAELDALDDAPRGEPQQPDTDEEDEWAAWAEREPVRIDVEEELAAIKDELETTEEGQEEQESDARSAGGSGEDEDAKAEDEDADTDAGADDEKGGPAA